MILSPNNNPCLKQVEHSDHVINVILGGPTVGGTSYAGRKSPTPLLLLRHLEGRPAAEIIQPLLLPRVIEEQRGGQELSRRLT